MCVSGGELSSEELDERLLMGGIEGGDLGHATDKGDQRDI